MASRRKQKSLALLRPRTVSLRAPFVAEMLADADESIAKGALDDSARVRSRSLGRPTTTLTASVAAELGRLG